MAAASRGLRDRFDAVAVLIELKAVLPTFWGMKALIVDEGGRVAERLHPALEQEGYVVESAQARGEALWLAGESDVDVVVVCSSRPGVHDVPTIEALREDGEIAPILVMARRGGSDETVAALNAGADDVVVSPVPFAEVAARLRALTRRPPELLPDDLTLGDLRLDRAARCAVRDCDGEPVTISLSAREFALLELLMRHPGQVISRARIADHVWGAGHEAGSNVVDQVVSHLRAKLDRPFGRRDILTVRGTGYRMTNGAHPPSGMSAAS